MCGIAGFSGTALAADAARATLEKMIRPLHHRGPDGFGFHVEATVALAHARLSIIDLATGAQPIHDERQSVWTVCNGEIFNFIELRARLEVRGHRFHTHSDSEVIVHLYEEFGDRFVEHLNGQFAIALWDRDRQRLLLARDRAGIRPLFHATAAGRIWFGSEIKSLLAVLPNGASIDPMGLVQALNFWGPVEPATVFSGIASLPPGHLLAIEKDGRQHLSRYWDWTFPAADAHVATARCGGEDVERIAAELRALLIDAVRLQLRADVPVGAYLSGGLDSAAIVALARGFTDVPIRTFSIAFADAEFDESAHQATMARHLGTEHTTVHCSRRDIGNAFAQVIWHTEVPIVRTAPAPLMMLSRHVRDAGYKVVLTGEGADEVFGGYDLFKEAKIRRFWSRQSDSTLRPRLLGRLYGYLEHSPVASDALARSFFGQGMEHIERPIFAHAPRWTTSRRALAFLSPELRASIGPWDPLAWYEQRLPAAITSWSALGRDQYVEAKSLLGAYLLSAQGDRVAMANSVEGRCPFLDHRLIEFANALPARLKIRGLTEKYILRRALAGLLPDDILRRTKQPYRAPDSASFFFDGEPLDYVADLLGSERIRAAGYFNAAAVGRLLDKCRSGRVIGFADNQAFVGILSTMLVDELFVRGRTGSFGLAQANGA